MSSSRAWFSDPESLISSFLTISSSFAEAIYIFVIYLLPKISLELISGPETEESASFDRFTAMLAETDEVESKAILAALEAPDRTMVVLSHVALVYWCLLYEEDLI